jgi:Putative transposase
MLFLDGMHLFKGAHPPLLRPVAGTSANELRQLVEQVGAQVGQALERRGLIERDIDNGWLATDFEACPLDDRIGHSIIYRIAVGSRAGQSLFTLQTVRPRLQGSEGDANGAARAGGFSLHAGVDIAPQQREKLERLCRYVSRQPVAGDCIALAPTGQVRYTLKTQYRDGTTRLGRKLHQQEGLAQRLQDLIREEQRGRRAGRIRNALRPSPGARASRG